MDEETRSGSAPMESEFVRLIVAYKLGEGNLGLAREVIGVPSRGWHVVTGSEGLCGPVGQVMAAEGIVDWGGGGGEWIGSSLDLFRGGDGLPE